MDSTHEELDSDGLEDSEVVGKKSGMQLATKLALGCGCLIVLMIAVGAAALYWTAGMIFPTEPLDFEQMSYTEEDVANFDSVVERLESGEEVRLTPEELTVLCQVGLDDNESDKIRFDLIDDDHIRMMVSIAAPDWSRYFNLELTVSGAITDGRFQDLEVSDIKLGEISPSRTSVQKFWEDFKTGAKSEENGLEKIESLRIERGALFIKMKPRTPKDAITPPKED